MKGSPFSMETQEWPERPVEWDSIFSHPSDVSHEFDKPLQYGFSSGFSSPTPLHSNNPFRRTSPLVPQRVPLLRDRSAPLISEIPPAIQDLASLEAKELQIQLRLIQLHRQRLLAVERKSAGKHLQYPRHNRPKAVTTDVPQTADDSPDYTLQTDWLRARQSAHPTTPLRGTEKNHTENNKNPFAVGELERETGIDLSQSDATYLQITGAQQSEREIHRSANTPIHEGSKNEVTNTRGHDNSLIKSTSYREIPEELLIPALKMNHQKPDPSTPPSPDSHNDQDHQQLTATTVSPSGLQSMNSSYSHMPLQNFGDRKTSTPDLNHRPANLNSWGRHEFDRGFHSRGNSASRTLQAERNDSPSLNHQCAPLEIPDNDNTRGSNALGASDLGIGVAHGGVISYTPQLQDNSSGREGLVSNEMPPLRSEMVDWIAGAWRSSLENNQAAESDHNTTRNPEIIRIDQSNTSLETDQDLGNYPIPSELSLPTSLANTARLILSNAESVHSQGFTQPPPVLSQVPSVMDEELAREMAEEEATTILQNGQLEGLHPMLKEQLATAMMTHISGQSLATSQGNDEDPWKPDKHPASDSINLLQRLRRHYYGSSTSGKKPSNHGKDKGGRNERIALVSKTVPKGHRLSQGQVSDANSMRPGKHDSNRFQSLEGDSPVLAEDEDACECGKARLATDQCYFCWPCDGTLFCDECWEDCPPHKKRKLGMPRTAGMPHEKSDPSMARKIFETLQADHSIEYQALLHVQDEDTSWFGTGKDKATGDLVFQDFGRYARLMAETSARYRRIRYPALVSFVGQTGAGKSSLIRLLIQAYAPENVQAQVPVVGSTLHVDLPTSGDVHLYADMKTLDGDHPILYADCEGLDGGERQPLGARARNKDMQSPLSNGRTKSFTRHIRKQHHTSEREILWADTTQKRSRQFHVRHLYPRLLYTFSDVIVFVMKNPRVIESTIEQLLRWAAAALETSSNQPVLPHAIIVLNAYDNASDVSLWDVNNSTTDLMEKVQRAVYQNHSIGSFAEFWRRRGKSIESVETLLLSFYSSVRVVRVPERGRPTLINDQIKKLYQEIQQASTQSRTSKHQVRMLLNSDELQPYLQYAFDHFSRKLDEPFDFVQASLSKNPISSNFSGNILKLAIDIMELWKDKLDGPRIFKELSFIVASCIMLDSARHRTLGPAEKVIAAYVHYCDDALAEFCNRHWPCEYVHPTTRGRCVNVRAGHQSKGHQSKDGKVLAVGSFISDFSLEKYREFFQYCVMWNLRHLLDRLRLATKDSPHLELQEAAEIHRDNALYPFFHHLQGPEAFISHTACYSCLIKPPEHALPCGHVLCTPCVQAFGTARGHCIVELTYCPLHHTESLFHSRWPVFIKPPAAGIRILSLDGGGIRGIVELITLRKIEDALGAGLKIQSFFDLIVGTSTGGIIGLGLGAHGWTIRKCISQFEKLCYMAFTKRKGIGIPGIEHIISMSNHSRYETTPIENALQGAFGVDQNLFAGPKDFIEDEGALQRLTKVGVTTVTTAGTVAVLANYNRVDEEEGVTYQFHRAEKPSAEIKTWQAARATSAAPTMFKPFTHDPSGQVYQDGAIYYNCPVELAMREQKLIWPDMAESCPDMVLSVGTGINRNARKAAPTRKGLTLGFFSQLKNLTRLAIDKIQSTLDSEQTWRTFVNQSNPPQHLRDRYIRLNLGLKSDPPRMDDTSQLMRLKNETESYFAVHETEIKSVADRLLATSFYFALDQEAFAAELADDTTTISGTILCRFAPYSSEIRSLGEAIRKRSRNAHNQDYIHHNPFFIISERRKEREAKQIVLSPDIVDRMISDGTFALNTIQIVQSDSRAETDIRFCFSDQPGHFAMFPISGFPRCFMEDMNKVSRPRLTNSTRKKSPHNISLNWAAFEAKKSSWKFAVAEFLKFKDKDPFDYYGSPEYTNPGDASSETLQGFSTRFSNEEILYTDIPLNPDLASVPNQQDRYELSTDTELREEWTLNESVSDEEILRRQLLRLLLSKGRFVSGPPRLAILSDPSRLHPSLAPPKVSSTEQSRQPTSSSGGTLLGTPSSLVELPATSLVELPVSYDSYATGGWI